MPRTYTAEEIKIKVHEALETNPATVYQQNFINSTGYINGIRYTDIIAYELWKGNKPNNRKLFLSIPKITRCESYKTKSHENPVIMEKPKNTNRTEEWIAKDMYGKTYDFIGKIIDFQTPLKNTKNDKIGKIDLVSYNENENVVYILELKKPENNEDLKKPENNEIEQKKPIKKVTLLWCVLEAYTYWKTVDKDKLLCDFGICKNVEVRKAVLIFNNCTAYTDFVGNDCDSVRDLMINKLHVDLFVLNDTHDKVIEGYIHK